jgi:hypothetical protein
MSTYTFHHACGHSREIDLQGTPVNHPDRIAELEARLCPSCWKAERDAEVESITAHLPPLEGTEKQIDWAVRIRRDFFLALYGYKDRRLIDADDNVQEQVFVHIWTDSMRRTMAKFWIDNREQYDQRRIPGFVREYHKERRLFYAHLDELTAAWGSEC